MMNGTDVKLIRKALLMQKARILNNATEFRSQQMAESEDFADDADKVSNDLTLSLSIHLHERDRNSLYQIERALGKIADKTYGQCESCTELIDIKRLKVRPFAALCIFCMEEHEEHRSPVT